MIIKAKMPARMSSNIMPQPPESFSTFLIGKGLRISKNRNKKKPTNKTIVVLGHAKIAMDIPAISSITTIDGSFPKSVATCDEDHIPSKTNKLINKK